MEFLKVLFENGAITWEQFVQGVATKGLKIGEGEEKRGEIRKEGILLSRSSFSSSHEHSVLIGMSEEPHIRLAGNFVRNSAPCASCLKSIKY